MNSWSTPVKKSSLAAALGFVIFLAVWASSDYDLSEEGRLRAHIESYDGDDYCDFPAIFNFGDSNSDTGGYSAAFGRLPPPNGETFFRRNSGRFSDGRLIIDFIAEKLKFPYLHAYLDSFTPNFRHGVNYAQGGATVVPLNGKEFQAGFNPFSLNLQVVQFEEFKTRTLEIYNKGNSWSSDSHLPSPDDFSRALYTIDIGQNDLSAIIAIKREESIEASISNIIDHFGTNIEKLYKLGARAFWIHNTGPLGCLPYYTIGKNHSEPDDTDAVGCVRSYNEMAQVFNSQLKDRIILLRSQLQDAVLTYVDLYTAKYKLISSASTIGFVDPLGFCCKYHEGNPIGCWEKRNVNGTEINPSSCSNPSEYISWDSVHYTEAANKWISNLIVNGSFSDSQVPISQSCRKTDQ